MSCWVWGPAPRACPWNPPCLLFAPTGEPPQHCCCSPTACALVGLGDAVSIKDDLETLWGQSGLGSECAPMRGPGQAPWGAGHPSQPPLLNPTDPLQQHHGSGVNRHPRRTSALSAAAMTSTLCSCILVHQSSFRGPARSRNAGSSSPWGAATGRRRWELKVMKTPREKQTTASSATCARPRRGMASSMSACCTGAGVWRAWGLDLNTVPALWEMTIDLFPRSVQFTLLRARP